MLANCVADKVSITFLTIKSYEILHCSSTNIKPALLPKEAMSSGQKKKKKVSLNTYGFSKAVYNIAALAAQMLVLAQGMEQQDHFFRWQCQLIQADNQP